jgi:recombination protein RecA
MDSIFFAKVRKEGHLSEALPHGMLKKGVARSSRTTEGVSSSAALDKGATANGLLTTDARMAPTRAVKSQPTIVPKSQLPGTLKSQPTSTLKSLPASRLESQPAQLPQQQAQLPLPSQLLLKTLSVQTLKPRPAQLLQTLPVQTLKPPPLQPLKLQAIESLKARATHRVQRLDSMLTAGALADHEIPDRQSFAIGIPALDHKIDSIPRSALTQVCTPQSMSSGRMAILCSLLAQVTDREEACALIDAGDRFDANSAEMSGVDLSRLLWVRCGKKKKSDLAGSARAGVQAKTGQATTSHAKPSQAKPSQAKASHIHTAERRMKPIEQAFKAADILIQNGGFGLIVIDLGEIDEQLVRKIPLTTWFRFARVIEKQPTALVVFATYPAAQSCAAFTLHIKTAVIRWSKDTQTHAQFLSGLTCEVELGRVRGRGRKPAQPAGTDFAANADWK